MGGRQAVVLCFVASLALIAAPAAEGFWPLHRVLPSVVRILVDFDGKPGTCSAFSVDEAKGRLITARHCAKGPVSVGGIGLAVVDVDEAADLALLQATHGGLPALTLGREPKPGDDAISVGYPLNSPLPMSVPSLFQGVFEAWANGGTFAIFHGNAMPGMSGGPIVNKSGEVVSVVLGGGNPSKDYQNVGFGAPYKALRKLLLKWQGS